MKVTFHEYFGSSRPSHWLRSVSGGNQFNVYRSRHVVVKTVDRAGYVRKLTGGLAHFRPPDGSSPMTSAQAAAMARLLLDLVDDSISATKASAGGFMVPFEVLDQLTCTTWFARFIPIPDGWTFQRPVIQVRIPTQMSVRNLLARHRKRGDIAAIQTLLEETWVTLQELVRRGLYPIDPTPSNMAHYLGRVLFSDVGAMVAQKRKAQAALISDTVDEQRKLFESAWEDAIIGNGLNPTHQRALQPVADEFRRRFDTLYSWRAVNNMWKTRRGEPTPDVFPLEI